MLNTACVPSVTVAFNAEIVTTGSAAVVPLTLSDAAPVPAELMAETR